eukprot:GDKI01038591.1.p1 GENE.GDKI01038591.1~~GDKI01038591.1.p1  ORF type:complete len:176 (-),score=53.34 GDKI01038591.1:586-1113(-)
MGECEALCANIGIMVAGRLRCLGPASHLKSRFGDGYQFEVTVAHAHGVTGPEAAEIEASNAERVRDFVKEHFPNAVRLEGIGVHQTFRIPKTDTNSSLAKIFRLVETNKAALQVEDYAVSETTLEQIFIGFASEQEKAEMEREEREARKKAAKAAAASGCLGPVGRMLRGKKDEK